MAKEEKKPKTWQEKWDESFGIMEDDGLLYLTSIKKIFVKSEELNNKGEPKKIPVTLRSLFLRDKKAITDSGYYRIFIKGGTYHISAVDRSVSDEWINGRLERVERLKERYKAIESTNCMGFIRWLGFRVPTSVAARIMMELV